MLKTKTPSRKKVKRRAADRVVTDGVVCYYDGDVLMIVPADDIQTVPGSLQQGETEVEAPLSA